MYVHNIHHKPQTIAGTTPLHIQNMQVGRTYAIRFATTNEHRVDEWVAFTVESIAIQPDLELRAIGRFTRHDHARKMMNGKDGERLVLQDDAGHSVITWRAVEGTMGHLSHLTNNRRSGQVFETNRLHPEITETLRWHGWARVLWDWTRDSDAELA